jgi:hypothetical protein
MRLVNSRQGKAGSKRGVVAVCAMTLLALLPLWFLVRSRQPATQNAGAIHADSPWRISDNSTYEARIALSPSGNFLAGICPRIAATPAPNGAVPAAPGTLGSDLVIWRVSDRAEVARLPLDYESGGSIQWAGNEAFIAAVGRYAHVYNWRSGAAANAPVARVLNGPAGATDLDVDSTWLNLDSDIKLQALTDGGMQAFRISTGNPVPVRWRWRDDGADSAPPWRLALQPASPGGALRAAIVQLEPTPIPPPTPIPLPTATPRPTPTPTVEHKALLDKEQRLLDEVTEIVNRLMGDDAPTGEEAQQLEERAKAINAEIKETQARLLPLDPSRQPVPTPAPPPLKIWATVTVWDLKSGKALWKKRIFSGSNPGYCNIYPAWSPDGKVLVLLGTAQLSRPTNIGLENTGMAFLNGANGKRLGSSNIAHNADWDNAADVLWLRGSTLVIKDRDKQGLPVLHFIDTSKGTVTQTVRFSKTSQIFDAITADFNGSKWGFASGAQGWRVFSRRELDTGSITLPQR